MRIKRVWDELQANYWFHYDMDMPVDEPADEVYERLGTDEVGWDADAREWVAASEAADNHTLEAHIRDLRKMAACAIAAIIDTRFTLNWQDPEQASGEQALGQPEDFTPYS